MKRFAKSWVIVCVLTLLSGALLMKGCKPDKRAATGPAPEQTHEQTWTLPNPFGSQNAKALTYSISVVGVERDANQNVVEIGPAFGPLVFEQPEFPLSAPVTLLVPPCLYRITIGVTLERDDARQRSGVFNVCENDVIDLSILTFEEFQLGDLSMQVKPPGPVLFGTELTVTCRAASVSAPDSDRQPLSATVWEDEGATVDGPLSSDTGVSGTFPDPFPTISGVTQRRIHCTVRDGRSPEQTITRAVERVIPTDLYVATTGNNDNSCFTPDDPCQTINSAISKVLLSGTTIHIQPGTYPENVVLDINNLTLMGKGGVAKISPVTGDGVQVTATGVTLRDLTITADGGTNAVGINVVAGGIDTANITVSGGIVGFMWSVATQVLRFPAVRSAALRMTVSGSPPAAC